MPAVHFGRMACRAFGRDRPANAPGWLAFAESVHHGDLPVVVLRRI